MHSEAIPNYSTLGFHGEVTLGVVSFDRELLDGEVLLMGVGSALPFYHFPSILYVSKNIFRSI